MTKISVVILNYNGEKFLRQFLPSVIRYSSEAEIIVADNASTDSSLNILKKEFPQIRIIELNKNYGFCGGYNKALGQVQADYFVLLNSDVEVSEGWLHPMRELLDSSSEIVAVQPKILSYNNRIKFEYAGAAGGFIDSLGYPFCRGRIFDHVEEDKGQYDDERQIFWATGACFMIRSSVFEQFLGFDEELFAHMEEIDLCWKINRSSGKVFYTGKSKVYHVGAGTLGYESPRKTYLNFRNGLILVFKHFDTIELFYKLPLRFLLDWTAAVVFILKGKIKNGLNVFKAHLDFIMNLKGTIAKRQQIRNQYPTYPRINIHPGLIVFDYYLGSRKRLKSVVPDRATLS